MPWPKVALAEACEINVGRTPSRSRSDYWGTGEPWLSIADMNQGRLISATKESVTPLAVREAVAKPVAPGTVLLSFKLSIGKVGIAQREMFTNEAIAALPIRAGVPLEPNFLARALEAMNLDEGSNRAAMGATLNKASLAQIPIPLPPIEEQRRIATILDQADALRVKRGEALALLDDLTQSIFTDMFGDPRSNPRGWPRRRFDAWGNVVTGNTPSRANSDFYGSGIEWLKSDDISASALNPFHAKETLTHAGEAAARVAPPGSILVVCIAGSPASIGRAALLDRRAAFNQQVNALVPMHGDPRFILAQLRAAPDLVRAKSTGGMKGLVSKGSLRTVELIDPPAELQARFASIAGELDRIRAEVRAAADETQGLLTSLQARAFSGRL